MLKIENVLSTSFDVLMDNIFEKPSRKKIDNSSQILNNLGEYIEIYTEKKKLEVKKERLDALLYVKDAVIDDLQEKISEQSEKKRALIQEKEQAVNENKNKTLELAKTSHEIRTPISGILGTTKLLLDTKLTAEQKKLILLIESSSNSLLELINDILDYSKIKSGELKIERVPLNLEQIIGDVVEILNYQANERKNQLQYRIFGGIPDWVEGDPLRIKQVLLNLAGNAVKFTNNGRVTIRTSLVKNKGQHVTIKFEVADTGIGIPEEKINCLFKTFSQVSADVTKKFGGTGLGLAISKELVEKMGGQIGVESEIDQGTTFWVTIPFFKHNVEEQEGTSSRQLRNNTGALNSASNLTHSTLKNISVLMVEDDEVNQKVNSLLLEKWGYLVDTVDNGEEALSQLQNKQYDIVLMDIQMPVLDGLQATKRIRRQRQNSINADIPIIAMTANALREDRELCLEAGMDDYIVKPFNLGELESKISRQLSKESPSSQNQITQPDKPRIESIKLEDLKQLQMDTQEEFEPLVELFLDQLPKRIDKIRSAGENGDYRQLKAAVHQLRGSASSFYAEQMVQICSQLEKLELKKNAQQAKSLISQLEIESTSVIEFLNAVHKRPNELLDL